VAGKGERVKVFCFFFSKKKTFLPYTQRYVTNRKQMYSPLALRETGYICNPEFSR